MKETLRSLQISTSLHHCTTAFLRHVLSNSPSSPFQLPLIGLSPLHTLLHALSQPLENKSPVAVSRCLLKWFFSDIRSRPLSGIATGLGQFHLVLCTPVSCQSKGNWKLKKDKRRLDSEQLEWRSWNTCSLCDVTSSFYYKPAEHSTAQKIKLMRQVDNEGDQKSGEVSKRQLSNSSCSGLLKRAVC